MITRVLTVTLPVHGDDARMTRWTQANAAMDAVGQVLGARGEELGRGTGFGERDAEWELLTDAAEDDVFAEVAAVLMRHGYGEEARVEIDDDPGDDDNAIVMEG